MDFITFPIPPEPAVFYFFDPCDDVVLASVLKNIEKSLHEHPREVFVVYVAPRFSRLMDSAAFLRKMVSSDEFQFSLYEGRDA
jgi:hypothetical protein